MFSTGNQTSFCVKLYLCSNPDNSVVERRALRERVFPKVREHCRHTHGLDFQVIDPFECSDRSRWPDDIIRQQLIDECRNNSSGPFLLALVGHQYGAATLPSQVEVSEFQLLLQQAQRAGLCTQQLERLFHRDENTTPPCYCLRLPQSPPCRPQINAEEIRMIKDQEEDLRTLIQTTVGLCVHDDLMTPERGQTYCRSALEADLRWAVDDDDIIGRCLVYVHKVVNAEGEREKGRSHLHSEATPPDLHLLSDLCDTFLPGLVASHQLLVYTTTTECDSRYGYTAARRRGYTESLCQQVYSDLVGLIDSLKPTWRRSYDALTREEAEQEELCDALSRFYEIPRPEEEEEIRAFVTAHEQRGPLVVIGGPCTGKTVLLAHCAQQIKSWLPDCDPLVISYICSLQESPSPTHLLSSLYYQIQKKYSIDAASSVHLNQHGCLTVPKVHESALDTQSSNPQGACCGDMSPEVSISELKERVSALLSHLATPTRPLVLILDGLDQVDDGSLCLLIIESLPSPLPPGVKLILTVTSNREHVHQAVTRRYPRETGNVCVQLRSADRKQSGKFLAFLLSRSGRRITSGQQALVNQALSSCCLTLYTCLLHELTSHWCSDSDVTSSSLPVGIHASISALLHQLEQKHGFPLVSLGVSYLTLSRTGLTEAELTDLLSRDDEVLSEYIQLGESPKIPRVDVERLLLDLRKFLIRRTSAGWCRLWWVSRHFKLVVAKRYLGAQEARGRIHSKMADYFGGRHLNQPFISTGSSINASRVHLQKFLELPYHLQQSGRWQELEHYLLLSSQFHQAMVQAGLLKELLAMLEDDRSQTALKERRLIAGMLKFSACSLKYKPLQLPVLMETNLLPYVELFQAIDVYVKEIRQERRDRGGVLGTLICPAPSSIPPVQCLKMNSKHVSVVEAAASESRIVATISDNGSAWIWKGSDVENVSLSHEGAEFKFSGVRSSGRFMLLSTQDERLFLWDVTGPEIFIEMEDPLKTEPGEELGGFVVCQTQIFTWWKKESYVIVFNISKKSTTHFQCPGCVTCLTCSSNGSYVFCGLEDGSVTIFDTVTGSFLSSSTNSSHSAITVILTNEDKKEITCIDKTGNVNLWDLNPQPPRLVKERFSGGESNEVLNTDQETDMLLVCQSQQVSLWDTCDWELWDQFLAPEGRAFAQAMLSQGGHLFLASVDACTLVLVWRVNTGECVLSLEANSQPHSLLKTDSDFICVARDGCLKVWDLGMIDAAGAGQKSGSEVKEVVVETTGEWFYVADGSETVWRWRLAAGSPDATFVHDDLVVRLCLSRDNVHLVTLSCEEIYVWKTETGQNTLRISGSKVTEIIITPNCKFGVSISKLGLSRVWKLANGRVVCCIHLHLSDAKVSPESTFLIGRHNGNLLAASLWSGSVSKRFSCVESSSQVIAFQTLSEHPDLVVVLVASGAVYTWKMEDQTVCRHFQLPPTFRCQPRDFHMSSDGRFALLSADQEAVRLLDLSQVRLISFKADGCVVKACMDESGCFVAYISQEKTCTCKDRMRPVLNVIQLRDGERVGSVCLSNSPTALLLCRQQLCVYVGFEDGSVGVYYFSGGTLEGQEPVLRCKERDGLTPVCWLPLTKPNVIWPLGQGPSVMDSEKDQDCVTPV